MKRHYLSAILLITTATGCTHSFSPTEYRQQIAQVNKLCQEGKLNEAERIATDQKSWSALSTVAQSYEKVGDVQAAERLYKEAFKLENKGTVIADPLAELYCRQKRYADAEAVLKEAMLKDEQLVAESKAENEKAQAKANLHRPGQFGTLDQNMAQITSQLSRLSTVDPTNHMNNLADCYEQWGKSQLAEEYYVKALKIKPDLVLKLQKRASAIKKTNPEKAEQLYERAIEIHEKAFGPEHWGVASALIDQARMLRSLDIEKAKTLYDKSLSLWKGQKKPMDKEEARVYRKNINEITYFYLNKAMQLGKLNKPEESIEWSNRVIAIDPNYAQAYVLRGAAHCEAKDYKKAIADGQKAISLAPKEIGGYFVVAEAQERNGEYSKAIDGFKDIIKRNPEESRAYARLAVCYSLSGKMNDALNTCDQALAFSPKTIDLHLIRGYVCGEQKNYKAAMDSFSKAIELDPKRKDAYARRAKMYDKLGQTDLAEKDRNKSKI